MEHVVNIWQDTIRIPTYKVGDPEKIPLFLENRVYQGSSGNVYPYPVIEHITDSFEEQVYTAVYLENQYLRVMILPEIGGRIQMAYDKVNDYHFVYHNQVIKPALVGLTGPWISGGIEFNWPQHHRPSTFEPLDWRIDENVDGSKTVWCSEIEIMSRMKGMHGITLYPDRAIIEVSVQLSNRTSVPQSFLWWANPAIPMNDDSQAVFPPDVTAVMDHGKRDVSGFPIADGIYYKVDYSPGTDISKYKNLKVPTSYMVFHSKFDFIGNYDHGKQMGILHAADHHVVPGKKLWTWGNGNFGKVWEQQLTDSNGPYVELMCGAFSDNQPDFSWLMPGEEKTFKQYFYPYSRIGIVKNANHYGAVNLEVQNRMVEIGVYLPEKKSIFVTLEYATGVLFHEQLTISPEEPFSKKIDIPDVVLDGDFTLSLREDGDEIISTSTMTKKLETMPVPAQPMKSPEDIQTVEELYLSGLHLKQYRHATYPSNAYFEEGLRRDPKHIQCNNALGLHYYKLGNFSKAEDHFRKAIATQTQYNGNPQDGEVFYNLGLSLKAQEKYDEAFDSLYKAVWTTRYQDAAYFELARLACRKNHFDEALDFTRRALRRNYFHHKARHLRTAILRRLGRTNSALREVSLALELDRMEFGVMWERYLMIQDTSFSQLSHLKPNTLIEIALDYTAAGMYLEAMALLRRLPIPDPMAEYYLGWCHSEVGDDEAADTAFTRASTRPSDYCFPNREECINALGKAIERNPADKMAMYYLGTYYYAHYNYDSAIEIWEKAVELDVSFPILYRNLGLAYYNCDQRKQDALKLYEKAFDLEPTSGRLLYELDQLYKLLNHPPQGRLIRMETYRNLVENRDDLTLEYINLLNLLSRHNEALEILMGRNFHPWEGSEGKISWQYEICLLELAKSCLKEGSLQAAEDYLERARSYPINLGEGKLPFRIDRHIDYYMGILCEDLGKLTEAKKYFESASTGDYDFDDAKYYNDVPVEFVFYQGLALQKLGEDEKAGNLFAAMIEYGEYHIDDRSQPDYFAVSKPNFSPFREDLDIENKVHCNYLMGLGYLGLNNITKSLIFFDQVSAFDACHLGTEIHRRIALSYQQ